MPVSADSAVQPIEAVGLAWWNTSLAPNKKKKRAGPDDLSTAARVVDELIGAGPAMIGLCEITSENLTYLAGKSGLGGFQLTKPGSVAGRGSKFDTCMAFDPLQVALKGSADIVGSYGPGRLRVGQRFSFEPRTGGKVLHVIISHWPSRNTLHTLHTVRRMYGDILRAIVGELHDIDPTSQIILMGDYNDEPFSETIHENLRATRDRARSLARPDILYNPFWRHMASLRHAGDPPCSDEGTYFHIKGDVTRWHTFDQMMFSNSLLKGTSDWKLDELSTRAHVTSWLDDLIKSDGSIFDHRPIVGRLQRA